MASARELFNALSRPPGRTWRENLTYHGARAALLAGLVLLLQILFPVAPVPDYPVLEKGMVPQQDIIAEVAFPIPKSDADLASERDEAAAAVAPVFRYSTAAMDTMLARVRGFMSALDSVTSGREQAEARQALVALLQTYGLPATEESLALLQDPLHRTSLRLSLERAIRSAMPTGVVSSVDAEDSPTPQWRIVRDSSEQLVMRDSVHTQSWLFEQAATQLPENPPPGLADLQRLVLILFFEGTLSLDREATAAARDQARQAVPTIREQVLRGQRIVAAHEPIGDAEIERMRAYQNYMRDAGALSTGPATYARAAGSILLHALILGMLGLLLVFYRHELYGNFRHMFVMALLTALLVTAAAIIANADAPMELIPIAFPVLVIAMLWDGRLALIFGIVAAALLSTLAPFMSLSARMLPLLAAATAALSVRVVRRRSQGLVLGVVVAASYAAGTIALGMMRTQDLDDVLRAILWGSVNGVASALVAMGFLPLFEAYTRITTDQTLLELADLNRPILKRLSLEASGTYAHSINVANLAEAAARAIGANPLLARVGAYYHDIGKIATPQYFIENQARGRNPHEQMSPHHSASLVRRHVEDGMRLAADAKLPESVAAFIPEHHGTQLIGYFYDQARKLDPDNEPDPADFTYPGPKPRSRETAILMLADSVESATKVLPDPTLERVRELVDRITEGKIAQGQFDEAPLTLRELSIVKDQLAATLAGIYHHRIDYPATAVNPVMDVGETPAPDDDAVTP